MSLLSVLKSVGKNLGHVGTWIEEGLKVAEPVIGAVDPPLVPIITGIEDALGIIQSKGTSLTAQSLQAVVTAVTTLETIKSAPASPAPAA